MSMAIKYAMKKKHKRKPYENPNPDKDKKDPIVEGVGVTGEEILQSKESKMDAKRRFNEDRLKANRNGYAKGGMCSGPECGGCGAANCYADGGDVKGVHKPHYRGSGESMAGYASKEAHKSKDGPQDADKKIFSEHAKNLHKEKLHEMKSMRGHDRKYMADGGAVKESGIKQTVNSFKDFMGGYGGAEAKPKSDEKEDKPKDSENPYTSGVNKLFGVKKAKGGEVHRYEMTSDDYSDEDIDHAEAKQPPKPMGVHAYKDAGKMKHEEVLRDMKMMKHKDRKYLAEGGEVDLPMDADEESGYEKMPVDAFHEDYSDDSSDEQDMIEAIMHKMKAKMLSKGGRVANDTGNGMEADKLPNQYDDLVLRDDLEFNYTGKNSGDEIGNEQKDEDEEDVVSQIMKSRKKKDRLPHPA